MSDIFCVTDRKHCNTDFLKRIDEIASFKPKGIILREKDLSENDYEDIAKSVLKICDKYGVQCILHSFISVAVKLNVKAVHLPMSALLNMSDKDKAKFDVIGASCHSEQDAISAEKSGCTYITSGHIFATDCKKGLAPRGLDFLQRVCESVSLPVYAIGGVNADNFESVLSCGAKGCCVMSMFMQCDDVKNCFAHLEKAGKK